VITVFCVPCLLWISDRNLAVFMATFLGV